MNEIGGCRIIKQLSEGSFGRTFVGEHIATGKKVCIKENAVGDPLGIKLFKEEALILWDLHHESLVPIKNYIEIEQDGEIYQFIVMKFIDSITLHSFVKKYGLLDDEHICWILQSVLKSLVYLHFYKIIHCDIKPENIMIEAPLHNTILVDFGLAVTGDNAKARAKGGTPYYLPPEFELGYPPIKASDIYSLGMVGLFLAGGDKHLESKSVPKDMNENIAEVIKKMIRKDPLSRYVEAAQVLQALGNARVKAFGRSESLEMIKLRNGKVLGPEDL